MSKLKKIKVGDMVWDSNKGYGFVTNTDFKMIHSIIARFGDESIAYTVNGVRSKGNERTLFVDKVDKEVVESLRRVRLSNGCNYYYVSDSGEITMKAEESSKIDDSRFNSGNYFSSIDDLGDSSIYLAFMKLRRSKY